MKTVINFKYSALLLHVLFWGLLLLLPYLLSSRETDYKIGYLPGYYFTISGVIHMAIFYGNAYVLYPRLFNRKYGWLYFITGALLIIGSFKLKYQILAEWFPAVLKDITVYKFIFAPSVVIFIISIIYRQLADRNKREQVQAEKRSEKLATELKFLRSQISPHFLFNVLTNLVSLARIKSDKLEPSLLMLSELMRYMLYDSQGNKISLTNEAAYLKSYIELQKLRFNDTISIETIIDYPPDKQHHLIEPMLLVPFVENAFKHGAGLLKNSFIKIVLQVRSDHMFFQVINTYDIQNTAKDPDSGIGLANVKHRLNLLYPGKYTLQIKDDHEIYNVELNLDLR